MRRIRAGLAVVVLLVPLRAAAELVPLGTEFQINTYTTNGQIVPRIAAGTSGEFVVTWTSDGQDGDYMGVFGQRYDSAGATLGTEFRTNDYTTGDQKLQACTVMPDGSFVVVWTSTAQDGSGDGVFGQRYDSVGQPDGTEFQVNSFTTGAQNGTDVVATSNGSFVVVWESAGQDGSAYGIFGQRYDSAGQPAGTEFQVNTYTTAGQYGPAVAGNAAGAFVVVWYSAHSGYYHDIFAQRFNSAGNPQGTEFQVNTYTTNSQFTPAVAVADDGSFVVAWTNVAEQDGNSRGTFGQRYDSAGGTAGTEFQVNSHTLGSQVYPRIGMGSAGDFMIVWQADINGSYLDVFGQHFASTGQQTGTEFQLNTFTTSFQSEPVVAPGTAGTFVVAWKSRNEDGDYTGIFGQRFEPGIGPGGGICPASPANGCAAAVKSQLQLKIGSVPSKNKFKWKFQGGLALMQSDFGDPTTSASYRVCIYDDNAPVALLKVGPSGMRWSPIGTKGYMYKDSSGSVDGIIKMKLLAGGGDKNKLQAKGKGSEFPMPIPVSGTRFFAQTSAVTVQLFEDNDDCYSTSFTDAETLKNDGSQYKAKQ